MSKYLIELTRFEASFLVEYNLDGSLLSIKANNGEAPLKILKFFWTNAPYHIMGIEWYKRQKNVKVTLVPEDLSFDRFWSMYNHKHGKKSKCERLWLSLSEEEQLKVLLHIPLYDKHLAQNPSIAKKYPETYLNAAAWNN